MRGIENQTQRELDFEEYEALIKCAKILETGFKKRIFKVFISPQQQNITDIYGINFCFNLVEFEPLKSEKAIVTGKSF